MCVVELSNREEIALGSVIATVGSTAVYLSQQPVPDSIKWPIVTILGLVAFAGGTFWAIFVSAKVGADVPLPPQVEPVKTKKKGVKSSASKASSDSQAETKG
jgi:hypothetical protein